MKRHGFVVPAVLGMSAALFVAGAASAAVILGPPIEVPSLPGYDQPHDSPSLAVLNDGSFAVARTTYSRGFEILFYGSDGNLLREPVIVHPDRSPGPGPFHGGVGAFGDRYLVTWQVFGRGKAHAAFFSRSGERIGRIFPWPYSETLYAYSLFHFARGHRGRVLPFFSFLFGEDRFGFPVYGYWSRVFGPDGRFLGDPVELVTRRHVLGVEDAALDETGRFVVAFLRCPRDPLSRQPCTRGLQRFDGAWRPRSALREEGLPPVSDRVGPGRVSLGLARTGDHLVSWTEVAGSFPDHEVRVLARLFRRDGSPTPRVLRLNGPGAHATILPAVRVTHSRTFVVAWADSPEGFGFDLYMRDVDGRTGKPGELLHFASVPGTPDVASRLYAFDLQMNSTGRGVIWYGDHFQLVTVEPEDNR